MSRVVVVSAAIVRDNRVLLAQRSPDSSFPWCWCTPGGKVEAGESRFDALRRELREEVGLLVLNGAVLSTIYSIDADPPAARYPRTILCSRIEWDDVREDPRPGDKIVGVGWFSADEVGRLILAPADEAERAALIAMLRGPQ